MTFVTACGTGEQGREDDVALRRVSDTNQNTVNNGGTNGDTGRDIPGRGGDTPSEDETIIGGGGITGNDGTTDGNGTTGGNRGATGENNGTTGGNGDGEYTADDEGQVGGGNDDIRMDDKAQNKVEKLKEVSHASVIVVNDRAYVGVLMDNHAKDGLTKETKKKISDAVKSTDKNVKQVYTSSNPEVIERMGEYGDKLQGSQPVQGISDEFTQAMQQFFPEAK